MLTCTDPPKHSCGCPATPENTYERIADGRTHRRCRTCKLESTKRPQAEHAPLLPVKPKPRTVTRETMAFCERCARGECKHNSSFRCVSPVVTPHATRGVRSGVCLCGSAWSLRWPSLIQAVEKTRPKSRGGVRQ